MRLPALALLTLALYLSWVIGSGVLVAAPRRRRAWRDRHFKGWSRAVLRLLRVEVRRSGDAPPAPFVLIANHLGYLDVLVLASCLPDVVFVAKSEVARWPVVGHLAKGMGTLFIDRGSKRDVPRVVRSIEERLEAGWGIVIFPEGTSTDGAGVGRFKPGLLEAPAAAGLSVHFVALSYETSRADEAARTSICWWGEMGFGSHLWRLAGLARAEARVSFGGEPIRHPDRKQLANRLREGVLSLFQPTSPPEAFPFGDSV